MAATHPQASTIPTANPQGADAFLEAMLNRRSIYSLKNTSPVPDSRIEEIVSHVIKHTPAPFNVQSARAVVLLKGEHEKFWTMMAEHVKTTVDERGWAFFKPKLDEYKTGYGSVLFFEDQTTLDATCDDMKAKGRGAVTVKVPTWNLHSTGMHQYACWTAFAAEGFGCNLQHYDGYIDDEIIKEWGLSEGWKLQAQLVFGTPTGGPRMEKTFKPIEERVKVFGA